MPVKDEREYRGVVDFQINQENKENEYIVEGYATTFNSPYTLYEDEEDNIIVQEEVDRNAFNGTDLTDVIMQYDHKGRVFARTSNNTLVITPDEHGLHIRAFLGGTEIGRNLYEEIKGGYTTKMSFGFIVDDESTEWRNTTGKKILLRTIRHIKKLFDVSSVSIPANDQTIISSRSYSKGVIAEAKVEYLKAQEEARSKQKQKIKILLEINK